MSLKDKVFVQRSPTLFIEGIVVGYILFQGTKTYRVLINDQEIIDVSEKEILSADSERVLAAKRFNNLREARPNEFN